MEIIQLSYVIYPPESQDNPYNLSFENQLAKKIYLSLTTGQPDLSKAFENKYLFRQFKKTKIESIEYEDLTIHNIAIAEDVSEMIAASIDSLENIEKDIDLSLTGLIRRLFEDSEFRCLVKNIDRFLDREIANQIIDEANFRGISPKEVLYQDYKLKDSVPDLETNNEIAEI